MTHPPSPSMTIIRVFVSSSDTHSERRLDTGLTVQQLKVNFNQPVGAELTRRTSSRPLPVFPRNTRSSGCTAPPRAMTSSQT